MTHKSERYRCLKPWEMDPSEAMAPRVPMIKDQLQYLKISQTALFVSDEETEDTSEESVEKDAEATAEESITGSGSSSCGGCSDEEPIPKKKSVDVAVHTVFSNGEKYIIENVPKTHAVIPKAHLKRLQNKEDIV